jgi:hypothetical protein
MAGPNNGIRQPESVENIADAPASGYADGALVYDVTATVLYLLVAGAWKVVPFTP